MSAILVALTLAGLPEAATATDPVTQCVMALTDPATAQGLAQAQTELARARHAQKDVAGALVAWRLAAALRPGDASTLDELALAEQADGRALLAEQLWLQALAGEPAHAATHFHLAESLVARATAAHAPAAAADLTQAADHLDHALAAPDHDPAVPCVQGRVAALRGLCVEADAAADACRKSLPRKQARRVLAELTAARGDCRVQLGEYDAAAQRFAEAGAAGAEVSRRLLELEALRRKSAVVAAPERPQAIRDARALALQVLDHIDRRAGPEQWQAALAQALHATPDVGIGHAALAELAALAGATAQAETAWLRALQLGLGDEAQTARAQAGLGRLYLRWPGSPRAAEAAAVLAEAVRRQPLATELRWDLVQALRTSGQLRRALLELQRYLRDPAADRPELRRDALALRRSLEASVGASASDQPGEEAQAAAGSDDVRLQAQRLAGRDRFRDAANLLQRAIAGGAKRPELQRDLAMYLHGLGDIEGAIAAMNDALRISEAQPQVQAELGRWLLRAGRTEQGRRHLQRAETLGVEDVVPLVVRLDAEALPGGLWRDLGQRPQLRRMNARLDRVLARRTLASAETNDSRALRNQLQSRLDQADGTWAALVALALLLAAFAAWRRWGGQDLRALITLHPETGPEVQRILAAVRHEVLKHNTLAMGGLLEVVAQGDARAARAARDRLLGVGGQEGVMDRLQGYCSELQRLARARGMRLNLRRRDPAMSALLQGFSILARQAGPLGRLDRLAVWRRRRLLRHLRTAARLLNAEGYEAVRNLLDTVRLLRIDAELLHIVFERTRHEPALVAAAVAPLQLQASELPVWVLMPRAAFEDALTNLLRNALHASLHAGERPIVVGLAVEVVVSQVTGLESVVLAVQDRAPGELSAAVLNGTALAPGREIEHGLGLAADLIRRHDGGLDVRTEPAPWRKAVLVRLPRAFPYDAQAGRRST